MNKKRVIRTASGTVTLGAYAKAWKSILAAPAGTTFKSSLCTWWPATREEILNQFSEGLADRINQHRPWFNKGRKWDDQWQTETLRASRALNTPRLAIHWLPAWLRSRFQHRISEAY